MFYCGNTCVYSVIIILLLVYGRQYVTVLYECQQLLLQHDISMTPVYLSTFTNVLSFSFQPLFTVKPLSTKYVKCNDLRKFKLFHFVDLRVIDFDCI
jgi:hypothetical protein